MHRVLLGQFPESTDAHTEAFRDLQREVEREAPDLLLLNEMPFGPWVSAAPKPDAAGAAKAIDAHERGLGQLSKWRVPAIVGSAARASVASREGSYEAGPPLVNDAFAIEDGAARFIHQKHHFPEEPGFHEQSWFQTEREGFAIHDVAGLRVGVLLCSELMFNEHARRYGRLGADVLLVPRASEHASSTWHIAAAMAALVSGCYVLSSNRVGDESGVIFRGEGFAYAPDGQRLGVTSKSAPLLSVHIDRSFIRQRRDAYPCYLPEIDEPKDGPH